MINEMGVTSHTGSILVTFSFTMWQLAVVIFGVRRVRFFIS